ncbi:MAG: hypothetical protein EOO07_35170 [Chitinophagaceae bacterium]|nr:MAG: hypothetical protein EOO07_35170 [Chitinophagaceae bacterium]
MFGNSGLQLLYDANNDGVNGSTGPYLSGNPNGNAYFGFNTGNVTLQVVPFDFGISAVLGAGAIAAVKTARRRRKEQEVIA